MGDIQYAIGRDAAAKRYDTLFLIALVVALLAALVFITTTPGTIHADDSGETVTGCYRLDVPHPPGYPLFSLLGRPFCFLPLGSLAWRVNLLAVLLGAATVFLLVPLVVRLSECLNLGGVSGRYAALLAGGAALLLAFSRNFWLQSTGAKGGVYTLNTFLLALGFLLLFDATRLGLARAKRDTRLCLVFFVLDEIRSEISPQRIVERAQFGAKAKSFLFQSLLFFG